MEEIEQKAEIIAAMALKQGINITSDQIMTLVEQSLAKYAKGGKSCAVLLKQFSKLLGEKHSNTMNGEKMYFIIRDGLPATLLLRRRDENCSAKAFRVDEAVKL